MAFTPTPKPSAVTLVKHAAPSAAGMVDATAPAGTTVGATARPLFDPAIFDPAIFDTEGTGSVDARDDLTLTKDAPPGAVDWS